MTEIVAFVREIAVVCLCAVACVFAVAGTVGIFRFPDAYTRLQASSLAGTVSVFTVFIAALAVCADFAVAARVALVMVFFLFSNPTATHIIARYAWRSGIDPWTPRKDR